MAELKTKKTDESAAAFVEGLADEQRRDDCRILLKLMKSVMKKPAKMWGSSIVGFGDFRYRYPSGREGDWFIAGFSPRKQNLTLYLMGGLEPLKDLLAKLGKHTTGKSCLYVKSLEDVDLAVLKEMVARSLKNVASLDKR